MQRGSGLRGSAPGPPAPSRAGTPTGHPLAGSTAPGLVPGARPEPTPPHLAGLGPGIWKKWVNQERELRGQGRGGAACALTHSLTHAFVQASATSPSSGPCPCGGQRGVRARGAPHWEEAWRGEGFSAGCNSGLELRAGAGRQERSATALDGPWARGTAALSRVSPSPPAPFLLSGQTPYSPQSSAPPRPVGAPDPQEPVPAAGQSGVQAIAQCCSPGSRSSPGLRTTLTAVTELCPQSATWAHVPAGNTD